MSDIQRMQYQMVGLLAEATQRGDARTMPLMPLVRRVKRGRKVAVRDGEFRHEPGRLLIAIPDEAVLNLKLPEDATDLWLVSRIKRATADVLLGEKPEIVKPGGGTLVDMHGRPL